MASSLFSCTAIKPQMSMLSSLISSPSSVPVSVTKVTASTADGAYSSGAIINIQIEFVEPVIVTGVPRLKLNAGAASQYALYVSGSGSNLLVFTYSVVVGDITSDLDFENTTSLELNGGTIKNSAGIDMLLTLPSPGATSSLSANKNIILDTANPLLSGSIADDSYYVSLSQSPALSWSPAMDLVGSGIEGYQLSLGTSLGGTDIVSWQSLSNASAYQLSGLNLTAGTIYYPSLRAVDFAGNVSSVIEGDGWTAMGTVSPAVLAGTPDLFSNSLNLNVSVSGLALDGYQYKVGETASVDCSLAAGYSADISIATAITSSVSALSEGSLTLCVVGKTSNGLYQAYSAATVFTWTKDTIAPAITVTPAGNLSSGAYYTQSNPESFSMTGTGASHMYFSFVSCSSGGAWEAYSGVKILTLTSNSSSSVYVTFKDQAGNMAACQTFTIVHDNIAPLAFAVDDGTFIANPSLSTVATWSSSTEANFDRYEIALGTSAAASDIVTWTGVGSLLTHQFSGLSLNRGPKYFTSVKAIDLAGNSTLALGDGWFVSQRYWTPNGMIKDMSINPSTGELYLGGNFTYVGPPTGAAYRVSSGGGLPSQINNYEKSVYDWPVSGGYVNTILSWPDGSYYIGGTFTKVGSVAINRLAHILADGSLDQTFNPNPSGMIYSLAASGSTLLVGGTFTAIGGQTRNNIAALDATTGIVTSWNPNANNYVKSLAVSGSTVYAGGQFTDIGGSSRNRIAALDITTGLATSWNPNATGIVSSLALSGSIIYAGGSFTSIGGQARNRIAALDTTTALATGWNPNASSSVNTICLDGTTAYVGGMFTTIGGASRNYIAAIDLSSALATSWNPNANAPVYSIAADGSSIYIGGTFTIVDGQIRNRVASLDKIFGTANLWAPHADNPPSTGAATIMALAIDINGEVLMGGYATSFGGLVRNGAAAISLYSGMATNWDPNISGGTVSNIASDFSNGKVYLSGNFTTVGGTTKPKLAAVDAMSGTLIGGFSPNPVGSSIYAIFVDSNYLYVGGSFSIIGGSPRGNFARFSTLSDSLDSLALDTDGSVQAFASDGTYIYASGNFSNFNWIPRTRLARFDKSTGSVDSFSVPVIGNPNDVLAIDSNKLYIGGLTSTIGGQGVTNLGRIDLGSLTADAFAPNIDNQVKAISFSAGKIFLGGIFTNMAGAPRSGGGVMDSNGNILSPWSLGFASSPSINKILTWQNRKIVGGGFTSSQGNFSSNISFIDDSSDTVFDSP